MDGPLGHFWMELADVCNLKMCRDGYVRLVDGRGACSGPFFTGIKSFDPTRWLSRSAAWMMVECKGSATA